MRAGLPDVVRRRLDPAERYGLRVTLFAIALALVALPFGFLLDQVVRDGPLIEVDTSAANHLYGAVHDRPWLVTVGQAVSFLGSPPFFYLTIGAAAFYWWRRGRLRLALYLVATTLLGGAIDTVVKVVVDRDRPSLEDPVATAHGQSFPSGHAMTSTVAYGVLVLSFLPLVPKPRRRWFVGGAVLLVLLIGLSRLALGVHYISDVLGGFVLGLAWLAAATAAFSVWRVERGRDVVHPTEGVEPEVAKSR